MTHDDALVRRVRWRLLAWSGGTTLVVLIMLGTILYTVAAASLAASGEDQLRARASEMKAGVTFASRLPIGPLGSGIVDVASAPGIVIGGPTSGTIAVVWGPSTTAGQPGPVFSIGAVALPAGHRRGGGPGRSGHDGPRRPRRNAGPGLLHATGPSRGRLRHPGRRGPDGRGSDVDDPRSRSS